MLLQAMARFSDLERSLGIATSRLPSSSRTGISFSDLERSLGIATSFSVGRSPALVKFQ